LIQGKDVDLLFGLDVLKRHLAIIDLEKNCLRIHGEEVPFLDEHDLPEQAREKLAPVEHASASASGSVPLQAANQPVATKPTGQSAPATSTQATGKYPADVIQNLTALGVTAEEAIQALDACGGNPDLAANILFQ
jgi:DNA damage-inducible protein 1